MKLSSIKAVVIPAIVFTQLLQAAEKQIEVFPVLVVGTNSYANARILRTTETEAYVKFDGGIVRAKLADLPQDLQEKYPPTVETKPRRIPPPVVYQRVPIDVAIRSLESQLMALENSRKQLQTELSGNQQLDLSSESDRNKLAETNRRAEQMDRMAAQMQLQLNRLRVARDRMVARAANGVETNQNSVANAPAVNGTNPNQRAATSATPNLQRPPLPNSPDSVPRPGNIRPSPYRR